MCIVVSPSARAILAGSPTGLGDVGAKQTAVQQATRHSLLRKQKDYAKKAQRMPISRVFLMSRCPLSSYGGCNTKIFQRLGKQIADERAGQALYERAISYDYDVDIGRGKSIVRHIPPDVTALKVWLFNRRPDKWKEKVDLPGIGSMADRSPEEIKRALVQKTVEWKLVPIENVPPELLAPIDGTIDDND
jgi:hypothetical protein